MRALSRLLFVTVLTACAACSSAVQLTPSPSNLVAAQEGSVCSTTNTREGVEKITTVNCRTVVIDTILRLQVDTTIKRDTLAVVTIVQKTDTLLKTIRDTLVVRDTVLKVDTVKVQLP